MYNFTVRVTVKGNNKTVNNLNYIKSCDVDITDVTPMIKQFISIKKDYQDTILFYRMGDFYETFFEDAIIASRDLELTLTGREGGKLGKIPMAGVPQKAADTYIAKLLAKGHKVAICEQTEDPSKAKGLVERKVVKLITAGTVTETTLLDGKKNNFLAAITKPDKSGIYGLAFIDISTGEFKITNARESELISEVSRIDPAEILAIGKKREIKPFQVVPEEIADVPEVIAQSYNFTIRPATAFSPENALNKVKKTFDVKSLEAFGFPEFIQGLIAAGAIIDYLEETQKENLPKFDVIRPYSLESFVAIDANARRNLELASTVRDNSYKGSLLWAVNRTKTNMGGRLLRGWIQQPLQKLEKIEQRQLAVEELLESSNTRVEISNLLAKVYDIERLATKISNNSSNGRDFISLRDSLKLIPEFKNILSFTKSPLLSQFCEIDEKIPDFVKIIETTIEEEPPIGIKDGDLIKKGVNQELDYLKSLLGEGKDWLTKFENQEREKTGVKSLKVGFSKTFGYFIEVTHANTSLVPDDYIRKQTLTNAERYITPELKKYENEILTAETKSVDLEYHIFSQFREYAKEFVEPIRKIAKNIAVLDVLLSFAEIATEFNYVKPILNDSDEIFIKDGRHPVIEQMLPLGSYVPNDFQITSDPKSLNCFDSESPLLMILTGPNMAGKSTYMRQNALIIVLAQIGSFVPAGFAQVGLVDKIFTRVGAVDDLSMGQSTFMVEMNETAYILNSATDRSFILLDEIGRGTSTYDGVAIAWSVAEYISQKVKARTIFATHYHELNVLCDKYPEIKNYRITVTEKDGEIEFIRRVVPGGASQSYGIQVAKMAGLPNSVINRSQYLMTRMQKDYSAKISTRKTKPDEIEVNTPQLSLFEE